MANEIYIADKPTLDQVLAYVDTLETKLGLNSDGAGSDTIFARLAQIAGYVDTLESISAKQYYGVSFTTTSASLQTVVDLTGPGLLRGFFATSPSMTLSSAKFKLTADGVVLSNMDPIVLSKGLLYTLLVDVNTTTPIGLTLKSFSNYPVVSMQIDFKSSLKIEVASDGTATLCTFAGYCK